MLTATNGRKMESIPVQSPSLSADHHEQPAKNTTYLFWRLYPIPIINIAGNNTINPSLPIY